MTPDNIDNSSEDPEKLLRETIHLAGALEQNSFDNYHSELTDLLQRLELYHVGGTSSDWSPDNLLKYARDLLASAVVDTDSASSIVKSEKAIQIIHATSTLTKEREVTEELDRLTEIASTLIDPERVGAYERLQRVERWSKKHALERDILELLVTDYTRRKEEGVPIFYSRYKLAQVLATYAIDLESEGVNPVDPYFAESMVVAFFHSQKRVGHSSTKEHLLVRDLAFRIQDTVVTGSPYTIAAYIRRIQRNPQIINERSSALQLHIVATADKKNIEMLMELGRAANIIGNTKRALSYLEQVSELDSDYPWLKLEKAKSLHLMERTDESIALCNEEIRLRPDNIWGYIELSKYLVLKGDFQSVRLSLDQAKSLDPSNGWIYYQEGISFSTQGDLQKAAVALKESARLMPEEKWPHIELARVYKNQGDSDSAIDEIMEAVVITNRNLNRDTHDQVESLIEEAFKYTPHPSPEKNRSVNLMQIFSKYYCSTRIDIHQGSNKTGKPVSEYLRDISGTQEGESIRNSLLKAYTFSAELGRGNDPLFNHRSRNQAGDTALWLSWMKWDKLEEFTRENFAYDAKLIYEYALKCPDEEKDPSVLYWNHKNLGAANHLLRETKEERKHLLAALVVDHFGMHSPEYSTMIQNNMPQINETFFSIGVWARENGHSVEADYVFNSILSSRPDQKELVVKLVNLGMMYRDANNLESALEGFNAVLRLNPDHQFAKEQYSILSKQISDA